MQSLDIAAVEQALYTDGFLGQKGVFSRSWACELDDDLATLYQEAIRLPDGALGRGPRRCYVEIHPERLRGSREIATNPWLTGVCERVLGPDYQIVEVARVHGPAPATTLRLLTVANRFLPSDGTPRTPRPGHAVSGGGPLLRALTTLTRRAALRTRQHSDPTRDPEHRT